MIELVVRPRSVTLPATIKVPAVTTVVDFSTDQRARLPLKAHVPHGPWLLIEARPSVTTASPHEYYLRTLLTLDTADDDAVIDAIRNWGLPALPATLTADPARVVIRLGAIDGSDDDLPDLTPEDLTSHPVAKASGSGSPPPTRRQANRLTFRLIDAARDAGATGMSFKELRLETDDGVHLAPIGLDAARWMIRYHQFHARFWTRLPTDLTVDTLTAAYPPDYLAGQWTALGITDPAAHGPDGILHTFITLLGLLNDAFAAAQPNPIGLNAADGTPLTGREQTITDHLAFELADHIHDGREVKTCARDRCGQKFVHQQGRSKHNVRRRGALYCSAVCTNAVAQQTHRDKQRRRPHE